MKNKLNIRSFVLGIATTLLISTLAFTALAATNMIEIKPVRIMVSGEMFVPKDVNGKEVPVFTYEGTTYAPLRALGEAFGQKIGYDEEKKIATVGEVPVAPAPETLPPDYSTWTAEEEKAYQEFKGMWEASLSSTPVGPAVDLRCRDTKADVDSFLTSNTVEFTERCCYRLDSELYEQYNAPEIMYHFMHKGSWGWSDRLSSGGWKCGYKMFLN